MTKSPHILIVEDDLKVVEGLVRGLHRAGFQTSLAMTGDAGLEHILSGGCDLVLLDLMLPERSGLEILEVVRARTSVPIVIVSASGDLYSRLQSFRNGAVDFVPKPFFMEELLARIRARLAVDVPQPRRALPLADVLIDLDARVVWRGGVNLGLTAHEFNVLTFVRERAGRALTRTQIAERALPVGAERFDRTVDSHISRIRKKLGAPAAARLETVWGIGYRCAKETP